MPLVRYEVRCEHSLANPELYRTAVRDDSEGLLEGVAMAGLVGLVRQLGDLAEFASEIFHDLHDDIMKIVSRGQNLKTRVIRLEADLPVVEKALLAKASQFRFAYTARSKWRAPLPMDQNLCGQGELPRFVRNFYDDCRGPPRLFLLDKFDGDGRGACVKRYTDPTFFRISWVTSQLEKAEQAERECQEELEVQAQQERKSSLKKTSNNAGPRYPRERLSSAHFENLEGFTGDFTPEFRSKRLDRVAEIPTDGDLTPDEPGSPEETKSPDRSFLKRQLPEVDEGPVLAPLKISAKDIENAKLGRRMQKLSHEEGASDEEGVSDYVDALTTVGSDVDSEHDSRSRWSARKSVDSARMSVDSEHDSHFRFADRVTSRNHSVLEAQRQTPSEGSVERNQSDDFARRLDLKAPESPIAGAVVVREWESSADSQLAIEDPRSRFADESITVEDARNGHANIADTVHRGSAKLPDKVPEKPSYQLHDSISHYRTRTRVEEQRVDQSLLLESEAPQARQDDQLALANVEQTVTTPRSRRLWARDNGSQAQTSSILSLVDIDRRSLPMQLNDGLDLASRLRARLLENSGTSSSRALVPHQGEAQEEQDMKWSPGQTGYELSYRSSSNTSSPYTNISSSSVAEDDGFTSESENSSPKGPNFCTLLSPPESPPRQARGLMGSPSSYNTNSRSGRSSPRAPPITPFLSFSPSVSRSSSIKRDPSVSLVDKVPQNYLDQATPSPKPPPQLISPPQRGTTLRSSLSLQTSNCPVASSAHSSEEIKDILVTDPRRASENGGSELEPSRSQDQTSTLPNSVSRPRTWFNRSESNVAATLRAIRQAAAVASDDDTGSECRSDCS